MVAPRHPCFCLVLLSMACEGSDQAGNGFVGGSGDGADSGASEAVLTGTELMAPRDKASDLAVSDGVLYYSTQFDPAVAQWNPETGEEEKITWDWRDLEAFSVFNGRFFGSFSDSGVEGWVSELLPPKDEREVASQDVNGTLFRRPADLVVSENTIWAVDEKVGVVWEIERSTGQADVLVESEGLLAVAEHRGAWVTGGEGGVQDATGRLDERKATALYSQGDTLWAVNIEDGLFEVGGRSWTLSGPARPGPFVVLNKSIYTVDEVGGGIWVFEMPVQ